MMCFLFAYAFGVVFTLVTHVDAHVTVYILNLKSLRELYVKAEHKPPDIFLFDLILYVSVI